MDLAAALSACRTEADFYRVQIEAENRMVPAEVEAIAAIAPDLPERARAWARRLDASMRLSRAPTQPFRCTHLAADVLFYEAEGDAPRCLVIGLTGAALRMNLPIPFFLQALPPGRCDMLLLRDSVRASFLLGVPGYAADVPALAERIAADLPLARYRDVRCIGTSAGGAAALWLGALLRARRAVSVDGAHPNAHALRFPARKLEAGAFDRSFAAPQPGTTEMTVVHGADNRRDAIRSHLLAMSVPGARVTGVAGVSVHGVVAPLLQARALAPFLAEVLLGEGPGAALSAIWSPPR